MRELELATRAVDEALAAGASDAEATAYVADRFHAEARDTVVTKLERSTGRGLTVRAYVEGRKASLSTVDFTEDGLRALVRATVDAARFVAPDPYAGLPDSVEANAADVDLQLYADDVRAREAEDKLGDALALERDVRRFDARIENSNGSNVGDTTALLAHANSRGFRGSYRTSAVSRGSSPIARDGTSKRVGSYGSAARAYADVQPVEVVASAAAHRAVSLCGARKPQTMRCPVIFERDVASHVLGDLFSAISAANVAIGNSFLASKIGHVVGSDLVTIVDDGRLPRGLGSAPFDSEGVATRRTVVFERGTLRSFLFDTYYGRRLGSASTGNAADGGIGPRNFHLEPGTRSVEELIAGTTRGVFVLDTIGFSTESVTGTYSRGARGIAIENGELAYPIDEFTIAGNLADMLAAMDAVANDLIFDSSIVSPTFRVAEMAIAGL